MQGQLTLDLRTEQDILVPKTGRLVLLFLPQPYTSQHTQKAVLSPFFLLLSPPPLFNLSLSFQRELLSAPWRNKQTCPDWDEEEKKGEKHPILILALWTKLPLVSYQSGDRSSPSPATSLRSTPSTFPIRSLNLVFCFSSRRQVPVPFPSWPSAQH